MKVCMPTAAVLLTLVLGGCQRNCYEIEITPDGQGFRRKLTCWHEGGGPAEDDGDDSAASALPPEKLARIGRLYEKRETPDDARKHVFVGRFRGQTPADVGGSGSYTQFRSSLGTATLYVERFRGDDDLEGELARRRKAADRLADLLLGWFEAELAGEPNFDPLRRFLDDDLRRDLKNLVVYAWTHDAVSGDRPDRWNGLPARVGQYLYERGYLSPGDMPGLFRAAVTEDPDPLLGHLQRLAARKMGVPDDRPVPESLAFLSSARRAVASWEKYLRTTDAFEQRMRQWKQRRKTDPNAAEPDPMDLVEELVGQEMVVIGLPQHPDSLQVTLHTRRKPFAGNGQWDDDRRSVRWEASLRHRRSLPVLCFAFWSKPNVRAQEAHFGRAVLRGAELAQYALWYSALDEQEARQWDRLIRGCRPDGDLRGRLEEFRFAADPKPDPERPDQTPASLADLPRELLLDALKPDSGSEQHDE